MNITSYKLNHEKDYEFEDKVISVNSYKIEDIEINNYYKDSQIYWISVKEILDKKFYNFNVEMLLHNFVKKNIGIFKIRTRSGKYYPFPEVLYHGTSGEYKDSIIENGLRASKEGMLGGGYYFGDFRKSIRYSFYSSDYKIKYEQGIIFRFYVITNNLYEFPEKGKPNIYNKSKEDKELLNFEGEKKIVLKGYNQDNFLNKEGKRVYDGVRVNPFMIKYKTDSKDIQYGYVIKNPEVLVLDKRLFKMMSYSYVDMNTFQGKWDPKYTKYDIASSDNKILLKFLKK